MNDSGAISLSGDTIRYESRRVSWKLQLNTIVVIGESTTDQGPFIDDWWLCFATGQDRWYEAPFDAKGWSTFLDDLSSRLGHALIPALFASTNYASRIMWPPQLEGKPMFVYLPVYPGGRPRTAIARAFASLMGRGPAATTQTYSADVLRYLGKVAD